jgi:hypothetical protein
MTDLIGHPRLREWDGQRDAPLVRLAPRRPACLMQAARQF